VQPAKTAARRPAATGLHQTPPIDFFLIRYNLGDIRAAGPALSEASACNCRIVLATFNAEAGGCRTRTVSLKLIGINIPLGSLTLIKAWLA
jgi:hypothetical protein